MGLVDRFPGGRRPKEKAKVADAAVIEQARAVVAMERDGLPAAPLLPWQDQNHGEKLSTLTGKALDKTREILDLPCDPKNLKLLSIQKDAALSILSAQVKVDENRLRQQANKESAVERLLLAIAEEGAGKREVSPES